MFPVHESGRHIPLHEDNLTDQPLDLQYDIIRLRYQSVPIFSSGYPYSTMFWPKRMIS